MAIFSAILIFVILLFVHELGHLLAAKACGIPVISFSLGAGKALYRKRIGQTIYILRLLPVGGSVRTVNFNTSNDNSNKDSNSSNDKKGASR